MSDASRSKDQTPRSRESRVALRRISSKSLLADAGRVLIEHDGETYLLQRTRQGKLILTK